MIVSRMEDPCFEVAVFGRVSCGKSSLLNAVLGEAALGGVAQPRPKFLDLGG